jgi:hypothetical protein
MNSVIQLLSVATPGIEQIKIGSLAVVFKNAG